MSVRKKKLHTKKQILAASKKDYISDKQLEDFRNLLLEIYEPTIV